MTAKPKALVFIDHDIMIRHFIHNRSFQEIESDFDIEYIFPEELNKKRIMVDIGALNLTKFRLLKFDMYRTGQLRQLARLQLMWKSRWNKVYHYGDQRLKYQFSLKRYKKMRRQSNLFYFPFYRWKIKREVGICQHMLNLINELKPDIIFHPTVMNGTFMHDLILITRKYNIPLVCMMNSWDNVSTRALPVGVPDWLCVWGQQTKNNALATMRIKPDRIKIMGAAQFQVYQNPVRKTREEICQMIGVLPTKRLILYGGSSGSLLNEINHLKLLDGIIERGDIKNCQVIYRPHPWRGGAPGEPDFFDLKWENVHIDPTMKEFYISEKRLMAEKKDGLVFLTDYQDTHDVLSAIDVTISTTSTILLESVIHGKPVVNFVSHYDLKQDTAIGLFYSLSHFFLEFMEHFESPICHTEDELIKVLDRVMNSKFPEFDAETLKNKSRYFADQVEEPYGLALAKLAKEILTNRDHSA